MASSDPLYLFKETRVSFEAPSSALIVDVKLPSASSHSSSKRRAKGTVEDDKTFRARNCATASAVYHRRYHTTPKSFLWRVLEDDTLLSIRAIDVCKMKKVSDANLVLNFRFPQPIRPSCVALADPQDHDFLSIFVIDTENHLFTITLRPDNFRKRSATENAFADACKIYKSNGLSYKLPHRLVAVHDDLLVATAYDGGNVKLERNKGHDAFHHPWKETIFNVKGWGQGLRSLIQGGHTIKHGGLNMELTASTSAIATDVGLTDVSYLFTVCLDHRLRVWNLKNGQILEARDLLDAERNPQETGKWTIDPSQTNLIKIVGETEGKRLCVTYSPIGAGEFKFWRLEADGKGVTIEDHFPTAQLNPIPPPGSDVWTLADFAVAQDSVHGAELWVLWKNNVTYRVQHLSFLPEDIEDAWQDGWSGVYPDKDTQGPQISGPCDPTDVTEKWLQVILFPGRFTKATLETALSIYEQSLGTTRDTSSRSSKGMAESICSALTSTSTLERSASRGMDYEQFRVSSEIHWRRFYRLLNELDKHRGEALALAYEPDSHAPWVVCADSISAIRDCSQLEQICHNPSADSPEGLDHVSTLISTGLSFVDIFSDNMMQIINSVLRSELFEDSPKTDDDRILFFSDKAGFWRQVSDEDCAQVTDALGPNFKLVTLPLYQKTLDLMNAPAESLKESHYPLTDFGRKLAVKALQGMADIQWNVCLSQLVLLVHMEYEFDKPEDALHMRIDIGTVYRYLITSLKRLELVKWLAKTEMTVPLSKVDRSNSTLGSSPVATKRQGDEYQVITAVEGMVGHLLGVPEIDSIPSAITDIAMDLCAQDSNVQLPPHFTQCALLVQNRPDLAAELGPFCDQDPFSTYIQGRVHLALKDFSTAAVYFKKAAYGLSMPMKHPDRHSSGLLDDTEWNLFNAGMPQYYAHVVSLFEKQKAHSHVVEFARLALQFVNTHTHDAALLRTEIQSRLFSAAVNISHFDLAHSTLVAMSDYALQHSSLRMLIQRMCDNLHNSELVDLPFPNLENAVDEILAQKCQIATDVVTGIPYHQILYAWRIKRNDYRGAAAILLDRIQKLRQVGEADQPTGDDVLDTAVTRQYLMLINVLSCVETKQAWIATEQSDANGISKRKVVTLADLRREYQAELDRIAAIQNNQFGFSAEDEMDMVI
ncbi:nucleoporin Nup120/160-domain-containing protein [Pseudomassariella vexata]|uniref:Nucleoporin Nup120/160-domain-containing protein n=1 Tax=Pseudomassariella vexata TaxID=1141098 RepID=A0A1Y2DLV3_9PEZI|nr:nucleoporin Nup120/160-domain-containing protein [Pseudomassariella vexata]ORY60134.1 nucleoporin Nup120/160-domain-containing protein [Pseudomassariella vexata]